MDQNTLHRIEAHCTQEAMPRCQAYCPLHLDVRSFMDCMKNGQMKEARKVLERHLPIPHILTHICDHPCEGHCLRRDLGGSLAIQSLEEVCMAHSEKQLKAFPRPPKAQKIAIFGNGLAALTVAYELAKKSFPTTIFYTSAEESQCATSFLCQSFKKLTKEHVHIELEALEKQHATFQSTPLHMELFEQILQKQEYAAYFVDAHAAPEIFNALQSRPHELTMHVTHGEHTHICAGGMLESTVTGATYASPATQCGHGRQAALSLERLATGVSLDAGREESLGKSKLSTPLQGLTSKAALFPQGEKYSLEEAQAEAARCIQCECMQCVKECVYLQKYGSFPRAYTRQIYNNTAIVMGDHKANSLINGCMMCDQCTEICPERFSMSEVCLDARQHMVDNDYMPPSAYEFAVEDMLSASQSPCALVLKDAAQQEKPSHAFFPGCQLAAARSEQVFALYTLLQQQTVHTHIQGVGLMLSCCGIPAHWAGQKKLAEQSLQELERQWKSLGEPTLIMGCASCMKMFSMHMPHIPCVSLWELLEGILPQSSETPPSRHYSLHDPCAARTNEAWQKAIRNLAKTQNIDIVEHRQQGKTTPCCGFGGNVWCSQPELAEKATASMATLLYEENKQDTSIVSCVMCQDRLLKMGKNCLHILDVLPSLPPVENKPMGISARRMQRALLAQKMRQHHGEDTCLPVQPIENTLCMNTQAKSTEHMFLHISPELLQELERKHILHQDVALAVRMVEQHKERFVEQESGHYIGAWRPRNVTFWVRYAQDAQGTFHLYDAWCHRMHVPNSVPGAIFESTSKTKV